MTCSLDRRWDLKSDRLLGRTKVKGWARVWATEWAKEWVKESGLRWETRSDLSIRGFGHAVNRSSESIFCLSVS